MLQDQGMNERIKGAAKHFTGKTKGNLVLKKRYLSPGNL